MKKIVIFRTGSRFNIVTPKQWRQSSSKLSEAAIASARDRLIPEETFRQFTHITHRKEVQAYLRQVWAG